jgi:hypothetical protein
MVDVLMSEDIKGQAVEALKEKYDVVFEPDLWQSQKELRTAVNSCKTLCITAMGRPGNSSGFGHNK